MVRRPWILLATLALPLGARAAETLSPSIADARLVGATRASTRATTRAAADDTLLAVYVAGKDQSVAFPVEGPGGLYRAKVRYRAAGGKGFAMKVNGSAYSGWFPGSREFAWHDAGLIELPPGRAEVSIGGGWAHYEIAGLELTPAPPDAPPPTPADRLSNPQASPEARALFRRLLDGYGRFTLSGVHEFDDLAYVKETAGHDVAILSRDFIEYTPSRLKHGSKPDGMTEKVIDAARAGRTITLCWHWNAPKDLIDRVETLPDGRTEDKRWYLGFYTRATTFDFAKALDDPEGEDYRLMLRDIDGIAVELTKLRDARVPVLWRPLHEAEGGWFWWGARGSAAYVKLWRLMYDRLTRHHKLDNLIWVYTSSGNTDWYPGDDVVDVIGADAYPDDKSDPLTGIWNTLRHSFGDRKLLALSEVGMVPDVDRMRRHGVYWSYFSTWNGKQGPRGMKDDELRRRLASPFIHGEAGH